jgi:hypothetical protein
MRVLYNNDEKATTTPNKHSLDFLSTFSPFLLLSPSPRSTTLAMPRLLVLVHPLLLLGVVAGSLVDDAGETRGEKFARSGFEVVAGEVLQGQKGRSSVIVGREKEGGKRRTIELMLSSFSGKSSPSMIFLLKSAPPFLNEKQS